ncbi:Uncharacterised protein [uncultured archaeon]|nr:Uncharacterised protein [uncultured archaeon]
MAPELNPYEELDNGIRFIVMFCIIVFAVVMALTGGK